LKGLKLNIRKLFSLTIIISCIWPSNTLCFYASAACVSMDLHSSAPISDIPSLTQGFLACCVYRRPYDSSICLYASGVLSGDGTRLVGPACIITSFHDGYGVWTFHRKFQPAAATRTTVPLRSVHQHQDVTVQVSKFNPH
jgi:hypothetical protein